MINSPILVKRLQVLASQFLSLKNVESINLCLSKEDNHRLTIEVRGRKHGEYFTLEFVEDVENAGLILYRITRKRYDHPTEEVLFEYGENINSVSIPLMEEDAYKRIKAIIDVFRLGSAKKQGELIAYLRGKTDNNPLWE